LAEAAVYNDIKLRDAKNRNIIFLGKTRSGKSTVFNVLKDMVHVCGYTSFFSDTQNPCLHSFTVCLQTPSGKPGTDPTEINYNLNIIDTPGLFEQKTDVEKVRNNDVLKKTILTCLEYEITNIHAIFLVCSFEQGVNVQDLEAIREFVDLFGGAEESICLLITRAEGYTQERKTQMINDIMQHPSLKDFVSLIKDKIFFTGAISSGNTETGALEAVKRDTQNVYFMRKKIYDYIFNKETHCIIRNLDYFRLKQLEAKNLLDEISKLQPKQKKDSLSCEYLAKIEAIENLVAFLPEDGPSRAVYDTIVECHTRLAPNKNEQ